MINFRYHVVSLTAVFLSLAVGLVLGSTVLNGPMLDALNDRVSTLGKDNEQLRDQVSFLEEEASHEEAFAAEAAPMLLEGVLTGRRVVLMVLPTGEEYVDGVAEALELGGAVVTGTIQVTERFTHPADRLEELLDLAHTVVPSSVDAERLPALDGVEASAALWATVLVDGAPLVVSTPPAPDDQPPAQDPPAPSATASPSQVSDSHRRTVLSAYAAAEYLDFEEPPDGPADIAVVVTGLPVTDNDADDRNRAMLTTVEQFELAGPVVVAAAGPSGDGNVISEVRGDAALSAGVTTVDNASTPQGQVATGLAVAAHLAGQVGHYGTGDGATHMLPPKPGS